MPLKATKTETEEYYTQTNRQQEQTLTFLPQGIPLSAGFPYVALLLRFGWPIIPAHPGVIIKATSEPPVQCSLGSSHPWLRKPNTRALEWYKFVYVNNMNRNKNINVHKTWKEIYDQTTTYLIKKQQINNM